MKISDLFKNIVRRIDGTHGREIRIQNKLRELEIQLELAWDRETPELLKAIEEIHDAIDNDPVTALTKAGAAEVVRCIDSVLSRLREAA